jgi:hypothetical protein
MREETKPTWREFHGGFAEDMTMRDYYAGLAMQILKEDIWNFDLLSTNAYELADAMLKARERKQ